MIVWHMDFSLKKLKTALNLKFFFLGCLCVENRYHQQQREVWEICATKMKIVRRVCLELNCLPVNGQLKTQQISSFDSTAFTHTRFVSFMAFALNVCAFASNVQIGRSIVAVGGKRNQFSCVRLGRARTHRMHRQSYYFVNETGMWEINGEWTNTETHHTNSGSHVSLNFSSSHTAVPRHVAFTFQLESRKEANETYVLCVCLCARRFDRCECVYKSQR